MTAFVGSEVMDSISLENTATPELPWKPYNFEASFSTEFQFVTAGFGEYRASIETEENVAGCSATLEWNMHVDIRREEHKYNIVLSDDLDDFAVDTIVFYAGEDRQGIENEQLDETGIATLLFTGELFWADVELEIMSFNGLTEGSDEMTVRMKFTYCGGKYDEYEITFAEDEEEPENGHYIATIWEPIDGLDLGGKLSLALPEAFDPQELDTVACYMGDRDPEQDDFVLAENFPSSLEFNGNASWADVTVAIVDFEPLTANVDVISTEWTFRYRDGSEDMLEVNMTESGATSCRFSYDLGVENIYAISSSYSATSPGTFLPFMIRISAPEDVLDSEVAVNTLDRDWDLRRMEYGGLEHEYVVDDQQNPVVFLPAVYAQTHIQCKPIKGSWEPVIRLGNEWISLKMPEYVGMFVVNDCVDDTISPRLDNVTLHNALNFRGQLAFYYRPIPGAVLQPKNNEIETEILWRYVGTDDTVVDFQSALGLQNDINYRTTAISKCLLIAFPLGEPLRNPAFWELPDKVLGEPPHASAAIRDMWDAKAYKLYRTGCTAATIYSCLCAAIDIVGEGPFDATLGKLPLEAYGNVIGHAYFDNGYPGDGPIQQAEADAINNHANSAKWIPGDWGYIRNCHPAPGGFLQGENIIYLGASASGVTGLFTKDKAQFMAQAYFWGHGMGAKKLSDMLQAVDNWSPNHPAVITPQRYSLKELPR